MLAVAAAAAALLAVSDVSEASLDPPYGVGEVLVVMVGCYHNHMER